MNILLLKHMYKAQNSINGNQEYIHVDIIKLYESIIIRLLSIKMTHNNEINNSY